MLILEDQIHLLNSTQIVVFRPLLAFPPSLKRNFSFTYRQHFLPSSEITEIAIIKTTILYLAPTVLGYSKETEQIGYI